MAHHLSLVFTNAEPGRDDDFKAWYQEKHVPEVLANIPGFASGQRYELHPLQREGTGRPPWRYLTLYDLDADDVARSHEVTEEFKAAGGFTDSEGALAGGHAAWIYSPVTDRVTEAEVAGAHKPTLGEAHHLFLAFTNPAAGREREFDGWYGEHVPEVVTLFPGLTAGRLYRAGDDQRIGMTPKWRFLALYDMEVDDMHEYHRQDKAVREGGKLIPHVGYFEPDHASWVYTEAGPRITREQALAVS